MFNIGDKRTFYNLLQTVYIWCYQMHFHATWDIQTSHKTERIPLLRQHHQLTPTSLIDQ